MNEQEEIGNGIEGIITDSIKRHNEGGLFAPRTTTQQILSYLNDNDVVIKVDRELPEDIWASPMNAVEHDAQQAMLKAGYVAVEPLVKE